MAIFNSYVSLPEGKFYCKLQLLLTLFRLPGRQVRCDGVPDDLIMGCLDLWLGRVNFVCPKKSPNITSLQPWFSIGSIHFGGPYGGAFNRWRLYHVISSLGSWHRTPIATNFGPPERAGNAVAPVASSFAKHTLKVRWDLELGVRY